MTPSIRFHILTLFPELIESYLSEALLQKALQKKLFSVELIPLRNFSDNKYKSIDEKPFGGGEGMIFKPDVLESALKSIPALNQFKNKKVVYLSPQGEVWNHSKARRWAQQDNFDIILISGRYGGIDQRFIDRYVDEEISIGDYVLSGGELPALTLIESISRFIPGVLGDENSALKDSFEDGFLEAPQYTKPQVWNDLKVPEVLISGHHQKILDWKKFNSYCVTYLKKGSPKAIEKNELIEFKNRLLKEIDQAKSHLVETENNPNTQNSVISENQIFDLEELKKVLEKVEADLK